MRMLRVLVCCLMAARPHAVVCGHGRSRSRPPKDFVAVDEMQPGEQIPAMPLIAGAYGFVWVVLLGYVWSIGRRLRAVETELAELEARKKVTMEIGIPTASHFIFIPSVLLIGIVIGWVLGSRAAQDAYAGELAKLRTRKVNTI